MLGTYLSSLALGFAAFRLGLAAATLLALVFLWRRPRAGAAVALVVAAHVACWAAGRAPLQRPYAFEGATDRAFNLGMAAGTAVGNSPWEHTQARLASPEPLWNMVVAALAGFDPTRVASAWDALTPLSILAVAAAIFFGLRRPEPATPEEGPADDDAWERALMVAAVLGLSSLSMSPRPPTPPFWLANFILKPHHAASFAVVVLLLGEAARHRPRAARIALIAGALAWAFIIHWGYLVVALAVVVALFDRDRARWRALTVGLALSALIAAPLVAHLARDYAPTQSHGAAEHMWDDPHGLPLAVPNWSTLDLGPLFTLGLAGAWVLRRRREARDGVLLGLLAASAALWLLSIPAALFGLAPEPDELHYFLRFAIALAAGAALAAAGRLAAAHLALAPGRGHVLALAACLPFSIPFYWDPPTMDRYYAMSLRPLPPKVLDYAQWIRAHTAPDAVFLAGPRTSSYIPALTGRRILISARGKLKARDHDARKEAERVLLTAGDAAALRATATRFGVTHLAVDPELSAAYGEAALRSPAYRTVFQNSAARIVEVVKAP